MELVFFFLIVNAFGNVNYKEQLSFADSLLQIRDCTKGFKVLSVMFRNTVSKHLHSSSGSPGSCDPPASASE